MAKYLKSDSEKGYVEDYVDIQALKFDNVRHTALGNMLGDYDNEGNYVIVPEIVNELLAMPKYVVEVMDNLEICLSIVKFDKQLTFLVAFEGEKATLSLLEKVSFEANNKLDAGTWSNVNEYVLDVVETIGEVDRQALYMKWNIQAFPGNVIDIFNCEDGLLAKYFNIINRIKYNMEVKSALLEKEDELEEVESEYALDMFNILQGYPELLKLIQTQLKKEITEKKDFLKLDKPNFAKTFNELLTKTVDGNVGKLSEFERSNFESDKRNVKIKSNIKKYDAINVQEEKFELEDGKTTDKKLIKIPAEGYKYKTFEGSATSLAKAEKDANNKSVENAIKTLLGKGKGKKSELYDYLSKMGIKPETIASQNIVDTVALRTLKDLELRKTKVDNKTLLVSGAAGSGKDNNKKDDNKKEKKDGKKEDDKKKDNKKGEKEKEKKNKKEENSTSASSGGGGYYSTGGNSTETNTTEGTGVKTRTLEELEGKSLIGQRVGEEVQHKNNKEKIMSADEIMQVLASLNNKNVENDNVSETKKVEGVVNTATRKVKRKTDVQNNENVSKTNMIEETVIGQ